MEDFDSVEWLIVDDDPTDNTTEVTHLNGPSDAPRTISGETSEIAVRKAIHREAVKNTDALANLGALGEDRKLAQDIPTNS